MLYLQDKARFEDVTTTPNDMTSNKQMQKLEKELYDSTVGIDKTVLWRCRRKVVVGVMKWEQAMKWNVTRSNSRK